MLIEKYTLLDDMNINPKIISEIEKMISSIFNRWFNESDEYMVESIILSLYHLELDLEDIQKLKTTGNNLTINFKNMNDSQMLSLMIFIGKYNNNFNSKLFARGKFQLIMDVENNYFNESYGDTFIDSKLRNSFLCSFKKWFDNEPVVRNLLNILHKENK